MDNLFFLFLRKKKFLIFDDKFFFYVNIPSSRIFIRHTSHNVWPQEGKIFGIFCLVVKGLFFKKLKII